MAKLTIAIPTFNRNKQLKENLSLLLPQLNSEVEVVIFDNYSDTPVADTVSDLVAGRENISIIRNDKNVGLSGNVMRCLELNAEWLWILCDDDAPQSKALTTILLDIEKYRDSNFITYRCSNWIKEQQENILVKSIDEFVENNKSIVNFIFFTNNILNMRRLKPYIRFGYLFSYSLCPHSAMQFLALNEGGTAVYSKDEIVEPGKPDNDNQWSRIYVSNAIMTLSELPLNLSNKTFKEFVNLLSRHTLTEPKTWFMNLIIESKRDGFVQSRLLYYYDQIYSRQRIAEKSTMKFLKYYFFRIFLLSPKTISFFYKIYERRNQRRGKVLFAADRFNRI